MGFGDLSAEQRVRIILELKGAARAVAALGSVSKAQLNQAKATRAAAKETKSLNDRTFLQNQLLFTTRRLLFYTTLGFLALGVEVVRMGFSYSNALQSTRVALRPVIKDQKVLNDELGVLYKIAALSPFLFKDTVVAFRQMYAAFQPLGWSIAFTNKTINTIVNSLAYLGKSTPANLNRAAVALQKLALVGRPMGQVISQLTRDGLPVTQALRKSFHLTADQLKNVAKSGLTAKQVIQSLNQYVATTPGFKGAAARISNNTLTGAWAQLKDILSQASGRATGGLFVGLTHTLAGINNQLAPLFKANKPIGIYQVVDAIDNQLTPSTHLIMNTYQVFVGILRTVIDEFTLLALPIIAVNRVLKILNTQTGVTEFTSRTLGRVLGVLLTIWLVMKLRIAAVALQEEYLILKTFALTTAQSILAISTTLLTYLFDREALAIIGLYTVEWIVVTATKAWAAAQWLLNAALNANPLVIIAGLALILYFRWKKFHDIVNSVWQNIIYYSPIVAIALTDAFGPIGVAITGLLLIIRYWKQIRGFGKSGSLTPIGINTQKPNPHDKHKSIWQKYLRGDFAHIPFLGGMASGGTTNRSGMALVGERGPELLHLPSGSMITPLNNNNNGSMFTVNVLPQDVYLDSKKIATLTAQAIITKQARA